MKSLPQNATGKLTESRVREKLESYGLIVKKPIPDKGIDFIVFNPTDQNRYARIQVKGRNPRKVKSYRWFQQRVIITALDKARKEGKSPDETWKDKVRLADFYILDAVIPNEMWVLSQEQTFQLISWNELEYGERPNNVFNYDEPLKGKQKEMNLEAKVAGTPIMDRLKSCKNNFIPLLEFLKYTDI
ncbi:hypothetical protein ACFLR8_01520 [Bacteroidota bacterium]